VRNSVTAPLVIVVSSSAGLAQARSQDLSGIWALGGLQTANASLIYRGSLRDPLGRPAATGLPQRIKRLLV